MGKRGTGEWAERRQRVNAVNGKPVNGGTGERAQRRQRVNAVNGKSANGRTGERVNARNAPDLLAHAARVVADEPPERAIRQLQPIAQLAAPNGAPATQARERVD